MSRPKKQTVDWYPHFTKHGRSLFIIEDRFGNDGYAFWFKLLEVLGSTEGQAYNLNDPINLEWLVTKCRLPKERIYALLDLCATLGSIDQELWERKRIIWSQHLVDGLDACYAKRACGTPQRPDSDAETPNDGDSGAETPKAERSTGDSGSEIRRVEEGEEGEQQEAEEIPKAAAAFESSPPEEEQDGEDWIRSRQALAAFGFAPDVLELIRQRLIKKRLDSHYVAWAILEAKVREPKQLRPYLKKAILQFDDWITEYNRSRPSPPLQGPTCPKCGGAILLDGGTGEIHCATCETKIPPPSRSPPNESGALTEAMNHGR